MPSPRHRGKTASTSSRSSPRPRKSDIKISDPIPFTFTHNTLTTKEQQEVLEGALPERIDETWPRRNASLAADRAYGQHMSAYDLSEHRYSAGPSVIMSSLHSQPSKLSLANQYNKSNGLRATIKRMFSGTKHRPQLSDRHFGHGENNYSHARNEAEMNFQDPGNLMAIGHSQNPADSSRSSPRPRPVTREGALNSHKRAMTAESRMDRPQSPTSPQPPTALRRRNTLPSLALSELESQSFSKSLKDIMGFDVGQDVQSSTALARRNRTRSRSIDENVDDDAEQEVDNTQSNRDSHIAFWRQSMLSNPVTDRKTSEYRADSSRVHTPEPVTAAEEESKQIKEVPSLEQVIRPTQSFDFGLAQHATAPSELEDRINTLEVKMFDFEYAIARLQGVDLPKPTLPTKRPTQKPIHKAFSQPSLQSPKTSSSGCSRAFSSASNSSTTVTNTVRSLHESKSQQSLKNSRTSYHLTADQFDALVNMIQDEKAARQQMELHIMDMQKEMELLQAPIYAEINYPVPGSNYKEGTQPVQKKLHRSPPFAFTRLPMDEKSRFSITESADESADENYEDPFETPRERRYKFDGFRSSPIVGIVS